MSSQSSKSGIRRFLGVLFLSSLTICLWLGHLPSTIWQGSFGSVATAQSPDASQLVQQGVERYQAGDFQGAIALWQTALTEYRRSNSRANEAIVLANLANAYQEIGQVDQAIRYWEQGIADYRQMGNFQEMGRMLVEQAQAYSSLGQYGRAIALLCGKGKEYPECDRESALEIARRQSDDSGQVAALGSLGEAHRLQGQYDLAIKYLETSLEIASKIGNPVYQSSALNGLGNAYATLAKANYRLANSADRQGDRKKAQKYREEALDHDSKALKFFQDSLNLAYRQDDIHSEVQVLLNLIPPYYRTGKTLAAQEALQNALVLLERLPDSRNKVFAAISLAERLQPLTPLDITFSGTQCLKPELEEKALELLRQAAAIAKAIQDPRSVSFARGKLGHLHECRQDLSQALELTQQAQWLADQDRLAKDSLYLWQWQAGRIFKAQQKNLDAIAAYEQAIATLEGIRGDILSASRDLQFDFRDTIEPIYRGLAKLKLERVSSMASDLDERQKELSSVLSTIDSLKLAELQNYFGINCVLTPVREGRVDLVGQNSSTAVFSSIILKERTAILVSLPNGKKKINWIEIDSTTLAQEVNEFRRGLERGRLDLVYNPQPAQELYDKLIRPFDADLKQAKINALVFVHDGILRTIPMSALHDGETFLIEKYAIATTPSLTLTDPKALNHQRLRALALGLTQAATVDGRDFPALANVGLEISTIEAQIPKSKPLLDGDFTRDRLQQELSQDVYPILHIATHGEFGYESKDTFLVTGNNDKLTITDLDGIIRRVRRGDRLIELLALTACQTAVGDERASLGLAGVAVQAGVKSALASLWSIDDASTAMFVNQFYANLRDPSISKAEALRVAQQALIEKGGQYAHPFYWAAFILIGNWL